jgi:glycosyltransferase involved in cell wall biosynthesis
MKVLEYMSTGIAVVAPDTVNLQDIITDGYDGVLFEAENSAKLASALSSLLEEEPYRRQLGANARDTIVRGRTWVHNAERILQLLNRLN